MDQCGQGLQLRGIDKKNDCCGGKARNLDGLPSNFSSAKWVSVAHGIIVLPTPRLPWPLTKDSSMPDSRLEGRSYTGSRSLLNAMTPPMLEARLYPALPTKSSEPAGAGCWSKEFAAWRCWIQIKRLAQLRGLFNIERVNTSSPIQRWNYQSSPASTIKLSTC